MTKDLSVISLPRLYQAESEVAETIPPGFTAQVVERFLVNVVKLLRVYGG
jgi:hypothetical protein